MDKALLDTDIISEIFKRIDRRVADRATIYRHAFGCYTLSVITVLEVVKSWHKLDRQGAELAGRIYADLELTGQPIGLADAMIAATALQHNLMLVPGNISHSQRIQRLGSSLQLDNWRT